MICPTCGKAFDGDAARCPACTARSVDVTLRAPSRPADADVPPEVAEARSDPARRRGRYVLVNLLGRGGMGEVHRGWDEELRRWVAVKLIRTGHAGEDELPRFQREARLAAGLDHPNLASIHDVGIEGDQPYIVMKFVDGETLDRIGTRDVSTLVAAIRDAARAVAYAHRQGIVHRDLKPQNIMRDREGRIFVMDFGLARVLGPAAPAMSMSQGYLGTPAFMAPEQALGRLKEVDAQSDVYALGATLYTLLSGRPPHTGETAEELLVKAATESSAPIRQVRPDVPPEIEALLQKAMARSKADRPAGAEAFADALDRCLGGGSTVRMESRTASRPPRRRAAPIAVALLVVAAGAWFLLTRDRPGPAPQQPDVVPTRPVREFVVGACRLRFVQLPPGTFSMGDAAVADDARPVHEVVLTQPCWLQTTEVTQALWEAVMGGNPSEFKGPERPVERISWDEARQFVTRLNERLVKELGDHRFALPTEAEWEYACRAGTTTAWGFGDDNKPLPDHAWIDANAQGQTHPVGQKQPNAWGLYDMHGNLLEWCADWHGPLAATPQRNPKGPKQGEHRVLRGGSFSENFWNARAALCNWAPPTERASNFGLRLALRESMESARTIVLDAARGLKMRFVRIPAGSFRMGREGSDTAGPVHDVTLTKDFWLQTTETTQAQWEALVGSNPSNFKGDDHPVNQVTWFRVQEFLGLLNERFGGAVEGLRFSLPTEAEWEYACRAGTESTWSFSEHDSALDAHTWHRENSGGRTAPVATKLPNPWGIFDMHGNVWEWCSDWYAPYASDPLQDPAGPPGGVDPVIRGGGWGDRSNTQSAVRDGKKPNHKSSTEGFRVAWVEQR